MPKAKKLLLGVAAACALTVTAAAAYGTFVVHQANDPGYLYGAPDTTSLHSSLVQMVQLYKESGQVLMPVAFGVGYQKELFDRALAHSGSSFKISSRMDSCRPETLSESLVSGYVASFRMAGRTLDGRYFDEIREQYKGDPSMVATYYNLGDNAGMTVLMSTTPSWSWLRPQVMPPAPAGQEPATLRFGADCQEPTELGTLAKQLRAASEYKFRAADGKEWVFTRRDANELRLEGSPQELSALAPEVHTQLSAAAKGAGGPIAVHTKLLDVEGGAVFSSQTLGLGEVTVSLLYRSQDGKAELSVFTSPGQSSSEKPQP